jgi:hypothetical protein
VPKGYDIRELKSNRPNHPHFPGGKYDSKSCCILPG